MTTPPVFVAEYEGTWTPTAASKSVTPTVAVGDLLVVLAMTADNSTTLVSPPSGGGLTYTAQEIVTGTDICQLYAWTAPSASAQSFTLTVTRTIGTDLWGLTVLRWSGSDGVGAAESTNSVGSGAPSLNLTTTQDNSAIVMFNGDWNAVDGGVTRPYRGSVNFVETTYFRDAAAYTVYAGYHPDAGPGGTTHTVGLTLGGQLYTIAALEIKGALNTTSATSDGYAQVKRRAAPMRRR